MLFYTTSLGPPVGTPLSVRAPLGHIKGRARTLEDKFHSLESTSNITHSGRRVLRSGSPNHSKPAVFIVFLSEIELVLANPRVLTLWD